MSGQRRLTARAASRGSLLAAVGAALLVLAIALGEGAQPQALACDDASAAPPPHGAPPVVAARGAGAAEGAASPARLVWLGDTLLADAARPLLERDGYATPFAQLAGLLDGDHVIANLEGPLTERTEVYARRGRWSYNAQPQAAVALAEAGVTVAGLANNHAMDRGPLGLADTLAALDGAGIDAIGAGPDREAALRPLLLPTAHGAVGVVALGDHYGLARTASDEQPGGAAFAPCDVVEAAARARAEGARWLVAFVHWGTNYSEVRDRQRALAGFFAENGYNLVVGHGPHVAQQIEVVDGLPVLHSLGNFTFGTPGRFSERFPGYGLVATTVLDEGGFTELRLRCLLTDNDRVAFQPRPCPEGEAHEVLAALHPRIRVTGGEGVLPLR
jgi:hypothetical protein